MKIALPLLLYFFSNFCLAKIQIIENGMIYSDDLGSIEDNSEWFALIQKDNKTSISKIKIKLTKDPSDTGEEKEPNANPFRLDISSDENAMFLIRGIDLKVGPVESKNNLGTLKLGDVVAVDGERSSIFSSGKISTENPDITTNHKLNLRFEGKVTTIASFADGKYSYDIYWIGDLNNDSIPDLFLDSHSPDGERSGTELHLSDKDPKTGEIKYNIFRPQYQGC